MDTTITGITTVRNERRPALLWVIVDDASGNSGLGETFFGPQAVESYIHDSTAAYLLGKDSRAIVAHWSALHRQWGRSGIGAEARGASAIDMALWDLFAKRHGIRLAEALGGRSRDRIGVYNTCAGPDYGAGPSAPDDRLAGTFQPGRQYEDLHAQRIKPDVLAEELLASGITAMKIWPFDPIADETGGRGITPAGIRRGLEPFERIRKTVGDKMQIALELHNAWDLPSAVAIANAAAEFAPMWVEDPIRIDSIDALARFTDATAVPTVASETLGSRFPYLDMLQRTEVAIVMTDIGWVGGITEARRVAELAALYQRPVTPHDCTGPVNLACGVHLCLHADNALIAEFVRAYYWGWYDDIAEGLPIFDGGTMRPADVPGHGVTLRDRMLTDSATSVRRSTLA